MKSILEQVVRWTGVVCVAVALVSCGGGGGGSATASTPTPSPASTSTPTNASASVGVAGGAVQTSNAAIRVDIPANALSATQQITIATAATDTPPGNVGNVFLNLGPDGTTFSKAVKIQVTYDPQSLSPSMSEGDLTLAYADANQWNNIPTVVDTVNRTLTAETTHFSTYSVALATTTKKPYGTLLGKVNGVEVYSNGCLDPSTAACGGHPDTYNINNAGGYNTGLMWQCVELVNRYFLQQYGLKIRVAGENANQYYKNASARGLLHYPNGGAEAPRVGDILVSEVGKYGHVAIVSKVTSDTVYYAQQNFNEGPADLESTLKLTQQGGTYTLSNFSPSYPIVGWVRSPTPNLADTPVTPGDPIFTALTPQTVKLGETFTAILQGKNLTSAIHLKIDNGVSYMDQKVNVTGTEIQQTLTATTLAAARAKILVMDINDRELKSFDIDIFNPSQQVVSRAGLHADSGSDFSFSTVSNACVKDNVTGLVWESKGTSDANSPRYFSTQYVARMDNTANSTSWYIGYLNSVNFCGFSDWRLPTIQELFGIYAIGPDNSFPLNSLFYEGGLSVPLANIATIANWSATISSSTATSPLFGVDYVNAGITPTSPPGYIAWISSVRSRGASASPVRAVRGQVSQSVNYALQDDEAFDPVTGLTWKRCVIGQTWTGITCDGTATMVNRTDASVLVNSASSAAKAWRLPSGKELLSIWDGSTASPMGVNGLVFPNAPDALAWSSTSDMFGAGYVFSPSNWPLMSQAVSNLATVRLVRR